MAAATIHPLETFHWERQPTAEKFVREVVDAFLHRVPAAARMARRMNEEAGTRFVDWVDHFTLEHTPANHRRLADAGYTRQSLDPSLEGRTYAHGGGIFPAVVIADQSRLAIKVESVADFAAANGLPPSDGEPLDVYRECEIGHGDRHHDHHHGHHHDADRFVAVERHGYRGFHPVPSTAPRKLAVLKYGELFRTRARQYEREGDGFAATTA